MPFLPRDPLVLIERLANEEKPFSAETLRRFATRDAELRVFRIRFKEVARQYIHELKAPPLLPFSKRAMVQMGQIRDSLRTKVCVPGGQHQNEPLEGLFSPEELIEIMRRDKKREVVEVGLTEEAMMRVLEHMKNERARVDALLENRSDELDFNGPEVQLAGNIKK